MRRALITIVSIAAASLTVAASSACAETLAPWWGITSGSRPTELPAKGHGEGQIVITAENLGDVATSGRVTIEDQLPAGLEVVGIEAIAGDSISNLGTVNCSTVTLEGAPSKQSADAPTNRSKCGSRCRSSAGSADRTPPRSPAAARRAAASASRRSRWAAPERFGIEDWAQIPEAEGGLIDTQAGSHPFQLTNVVTLNSQYPDGLGYPRTVAMPKDIVSELPAGTDRQPDAVHAVHRRAVRNRHNRPTKRTDQGQLLINECPASSAVGVVNISFNEPNNLHFDDRRRADLQHGPQQGRAGAFRLQGGRRRLGLPRRLGPHRRRLRRHRRRATTSPRSFGCWTSS